MPGRSNALGCVRETCWRVVLDANCVRGSPPKELEALQRRGFSVSLSLEGLREVWARSIREDNYDGLSARLRNIAPFISTEDPIAFVATALLTQIGSSAQPDLIRENEEFRASVVSGWRAVVAGQLTGPTWREIGEELDDELRREEDGWMQICDACIAAHRKVRDQERSLGMRFYPRERTVGILRRGVENACPVSIDPNFGERADALLRYLTEKLADAREQQPARNDWLDARHLYHLAWPAFLATVDGRLISAVDATRSWQRAWVRTPYELATGTICRAAPWGSPARLIASAVSRPRVDELLRLQQNWRQALVGQ